MSTLNPADKLYHIRLSNRGEHVAVDGNVARCYLPSWIPSGLPCTVSVYSSHLYFTNAIIDGASISIATNINFLGTDFDCPSIQPTPTFNVLCSMDLSGVQIEDADHRRTAMAGQGSTLRAPGGLPSVIEFWPTVAYFQNDAGHAPQVFNDMGIEVLMMVKYD